MRPTVRRLLEQTANAGRKRKATTFIGLGQMGRNMAMNLFEKLSAGSTPVSEFVVYDAIPESSASFVRDFGSKYPSAAVAVAASPAEAVVGASTVITMLPSSPQVRSVYEDGIIPALLSLPKPMTDGILCIDSTTLDVGVAREVALKVHATGAKMVDAPVSGGVTGAKAGTLSFLVGGTPEAFEQASPILKCMGSRIIHCGPSGAGLGAKICNNLILGVQQVVVAEAMLLGEKMGLDPAILASVINGSTGSCWASSTNNPVPRSLPDKSPPCERDYKDGFATALMLKDMGLASTIGTQTRSPLPLGSAAEKIYEEMIRTQPELASKDFSSVYKFLGQTSTSVWQGDKK